MPRSAARRTLHPARVRVRMYQVGFGDCFLLTFEYDAALGDGRAARHVLIDFGSTSLPRGTRLASVARLIAEHTDGRLDAIVLSHRHKDHLQGFGQADSAEIVDSLRPGLVVRSWTENPDLPADARSLVGELSRGLAARLAGGQQFAAAVAAALDRRRRLTDAERALRALAQAQLGNQDAIDRLDGWARAGSAAYVHHGSPSGIEAVVPGVRVRVLGPPTVDQWAGVTKQRQSDALEYWMLAGLLPERFPLARLAAGPPDSDDPLPGDAPSERNAPLPGAMPPGGDDTLVRAGADADRGRPPGALGPARWLIERMRRQQLASYQRIVHTVDAALNNTSAILLFEAGTKRLLFGGDAQIENWEYALSVAPNRERVRAWLRSVDLYKVGHHGSRNATPRASLFKLWTPTGGAVPRPMTALLSTRSGVHGRPGGTEVPRATLVEALRARMTLYSTEELRGEERFVEVVGETTSRAPFRRVAPP